MHVVAIALPYAVFALEPSLAPTRQLALISGPGGRLLASPAQRQFVMAGFCGGFTTFSVFSLELLLLIGRQAFELAGFYAAASVVLWPFSVWIGYRLGTKLNGLERSRHASNLH